ncbi:MAG: 50S ribosomal protein L18 [Lentisphaerae bacterium]|nr:50S ribosomal protein L18 [Lentisphaerota bacterium]
MKLKNRSDSRRRRHRRVRRKISGTAERPRMAVYVSNRRIAVQFVDDDRGVTLAAAVSDGGRKNVETARELGRSAAAQALARGIGEVVVDRGGFKYHGRIKALVEAAVGAGLRAGRLEPAGAAPEAGAEAEEDK